MVMVSPPVAFIDFKDLDDLTCLTLVVSGDSDDIAPVAMIQQCMPAWNPTARLEIINGADHFYSGHIDQLKSILMTQEL
jgi:alpha/beta superfamily hydrolase